MALCAWAGDPRRGQGAAGRPAPGVSARKRFKLPVGETEGPQFIHLELEQHCISLPLQVTLPAPTELEKMRPEYGWTLPLISSRRMRRRGEGEQNKRRKTTDF